MCTRSTRRPAHATLIAKRVAESGRRADSAAGWTQLFSPDGQRAVWYDDGAVEHVRLRREDIAPHHRRRGRDILGRRRRPQRREAAGSTAVRLVARFALRDPARQLGSLARAGCRWAGDEHHAERQGERHTISGSAWRAPACANAASISRKPLFVETYGERTKKEGLVSVDAQRGGARVLVMGRCEGGLPQGARRRRLGLHAADVRELPRLVRRGRGTGERTPPDRRESAAGRRGMERRRTTDQLQVRQQRRQPAGRALPSGGLRGRKALSDADVHLREALAGIPRLRAAERDALREPERVHVARLRVLHA